jgi:hypothetical protein
MTLLAALTLALYAAAGLAALVSRSRPVAAYLGAVLAIDALRWCQALLLPAPPELRAGWWLVAWWAEVGLYTASMLALPAMAWYLLGHGRSHDEMVRVRAPARAPAEGIGAVCRSSSPYRGHHRARPRAHGRPPKAARGQGCGRAGSSAPWRLIGVWLLLTAGIAGSYPDLRGPALLRIYDLIELGAVVVSVAVALRWIAHQASRPDRPSPAHLAGLALIAGPAGSCVLPWLTADTVLDGWPYLVAGNAVAVAACLVLLLWGLTRARRPSWG